MASACGSILMRIFQVFTRSARLTLLHMPRREPPPKLANGTDPGSDSRQRHGDRRRPRDTVGAAELQVLRTFRSAPTVTAYRF